MRLHPTDWHGKISARVEIWGCPAEDTARVVSTPGDGSRDMSELRASQIQAVADANEFCQAPSALVGDKSSEVIPDTSISASSYFAHDAGHGLGQMWRSRIGNAADPWTADMQDQHQFIQWDLGQPSNVLKIQTRGRSNMDHWVTSYKIFYSLDGSNWNSTGKVYMANWDRDSFAERRILPPITARFVRLFPQSWHTRISLRAELIGCMAKQPVLIQAACAMTSSLVGSTAHKTIPDTKIGVSSWKGYTGGVGAEVLWNARLDDNSAGWAPSFDGDDQWIAWDLGSSKLISKVLTRGRVSPTPGWVTRFKLIYSLDNVVWTRHDQLFVGNDDSTGTVSNAIQPPIDARLVKLMPVAWEGSIGLRAELDGCSSPPADLETSCSVSAPLVGSVADKRTADAEISASSYWQSPSGDIDLKKEMWRSRIDGQGISWCPDVDNTEQYLQWDFGRPMQITEVQTRGRQNEDQWVTKYRLTYSVDGTAWKSPLRTFSANVDRDTLAAAVIEPPVTARLLRLHPVEWSGNISLRAEVLGCETPAEVSCDQVSLVGSQDSQEVADRAISASSYHSNSATYGFGGYMWVSRLDTVGFAWRPAMDDSDQWMEWDFGTPRVVTKVVTAGSPEINGWVSGYRLSFRANDTWVMHDQVFSGNLDPHSIATREVKPAITAVSVRLHPTAWHGHIALRADLYGCTGGRQDDVPVDGSMPLSQNASVLLQSIMFAREVVAMEREMLCPGKGEVDMTLLPGRAEVSVEIGLNVRFSFRLSTGRVHVGKVEWRPYGDMTRLRQVALSRVSENCREQGTCDHLVGNFAKLVLPVPACSLQDSDSATDSDFSRLSAGFTTRGRGGSRTSQGAHMSLGVLMEQELHEYHSGLEQQKQQQQQGPERHRPIHPKATQTPHQRQGVGRRASRLATKVGSAALLSEEDDERERLPVAMPAAKEERIHSRRQKPWSPSAPWYQAAAAATSGGASAPGVGAAAAAGGMPRRNASAGGADMIVASAAAARRTLLHEKDVVKANALEESARKADGAAPLAQDDGLFTAPNHIEGHGKARHKTASTGTGTSSATLRGITVPDNLDWRILAPDCLDYVHEQGHCGAGFMFAAVDALADRHCINMNKKSTLGRDDHLSVQMALLCEPSGRTCSGGTASAGFGYVVEFGVQTESAWPYDGVCVSDTAAPAAVARTELAELETPTAPGSKCAGGPLNLFTDAEAGEIETLEDALIVTRQLCRRVARKADCQEWATQTFSHPGLTMIFSAEPVFCGKLIKEFAQFLDSRIHSQPSNKAPLLLEKAGEMEVATSPPVVGPMGPTLQSLSALLELAEKEGEQQATEIAAAAASASAPAPPHTLEPTMPASFAERFAVIAEGARSLTSQAPSSIEARLAQWYDVPQAVVGERRADRSEFSPSFADTSSSEEWSNFEQELRFQAGQRNNQRRENITIAEAAASRIYPISTSGLCDDSVDRMAIASERGCTMAAEAHGVLYAGAMAREDRPFACLKVGDSIHYNFYNLSSRPCSVKMQCICISDRERPRAELLPPRIALASTETPPAVAPSSLQTETWDTWMNQQHRFDSSASGKKTPLSLGSANFVSKSTSVGTNDGAWPINNPLFNASFAVHRPQCDRTRCASESKPHRLAGFRYVVKSEDALKLELVQGGPFYVSFKVMEDFMWFFSLWPSHAYGHRWGVQVGAHASVLLGWSQDCPSHPSAPSASSLLELDEKDQQQKATIRTPCWVLRNSWGNKWADGGYFRMTVATLAGPVGLAAAAPDGPVSMTG
jgi:hypothetical protein